MSKPANKLRISKGPVAPKGQRRYIRKLPDGRYGVIEDNGEGKSRIQSVHATERDAELAARPS